MSEEELRHIAEENEKSDRLRKQKLDEARDLIMSMSITSSREMPPPLKPGSVMRGTIELQTNLFGIRMGEDLPIFKYDVMIESDIGKKHVEFTKKGRSDYMVADRKKNCMAVFNKAIKLASFYRLDRAFYYDGQSMMYTTERIVFKDKAKPNESVIVEGPDVCKDLEPFKYIYFTIKECETGFQCRLSDIRKIDRDVTKKDRSAMQFVDVATSMNAVSQGDRFTVFANGKIFPNRPDLERLQTVPMKEGKVMIPGLNKSIKLIEGPRGRNNASPALAIDSLKVAFHVKEKVVDKAMGILKDINQSNHHDIEAFATMVRGLGCTTNHTRTPRRVEIHGISKENCSRKQEITLEGGETRTMSVSEYFKHKYGLDIKYPLAPLVMSREKGQMNLYPMEVLDIIPMQRVTIPQTTSIQSQVATKECAIPPGARQNAIIDQCKLHDFFNPDQPYLKAAGLGIIESPLRVTARLLKGPVLQYKSSEMEVIQPNWRPPHNAQFPIPAKCGTWAMYAILGARDNFPQSEMTKFADAFMKRCREKGMEIGTPAEILVLGQPPQGKSADFPARQKIKEAAGHNCKFLFFITNDFITIHKHLKLQERYSCIVTQDLKLKTAQNYLAKNQSLTMDNIVYKTNLKLGGLNYGMHLKNVVGPSVNPFPSTRLILGIGISQAPQMPMFTQNGVKLPAPAVVGYGANMANHPTEFIGDFLYQDNRKEDLLLCTTVMLQNVIDRFIGAVAPDGTRTGAPTKELPKEMIVFRQGVAEGFYSMCLNEEIPLMKAVLAKNGAKEVKVTYVIVQKEHNIRLMPVDIDTSQKPTLQNIGSGVVLDSQITHPRFREFFLNSHVTLQGTARTPRYTVLNDDSELSMNELQSVTHALCHAFQIVNSPVSIPAPLYIANRYAERGVALYSAKATDEMASTDQKVRTSQEEMNEDLTYGHTALGSVRINA